MPKYVIKAKDVFSRRLEVAIIYYLMIKAYKLSIYFFKTAKLFHIAALNSDEWRRMYFKSKRWWMTKFCLSTNNRLFLNYVSKQNRHKCDRTPSSSKKAHPPTWQRRAQQSSQLSRLYSPKLVYRPTTCVEICSYRAAKLEAKLIFHMPQWMNGCLLTTSTRHLLSLRHVKKIYIWRESTWISDQRVQQVSNRLIHCGLPAAGR